jgi:hypothetical protein
MFQRFTEFEKPPEFSVHITVRVIAWNQREALLKACAMADTLKLRPDVKGLVVGTVDQTP